MRRKTTIFVYSLLLALLTATSSLFAAAPTNQAKYLSVSNVTSSQVMLSWINGNGAGRIVVAATSLSDISGNTPVNATDYTENSDYTLAAAIGASSAKVVYDGTSGRTTTITGLTAGTTYYFKVYEFTASHAEYQTADGITNPRAASTQLNTLAVPSDLAFIGWSEGGDLTWTKDANATGYYVTITDATGGVVAGYDKIDVGNPLHGSKDEYYILGLPISSNYYACVTSYDNSGRLSATTRLPITTSAAPSILGISDYLPINGFAKIGDKVTCIVYESRGQVGLTAGAITINGVDCASTLVDNGDGSYALTYTVAEGNNDIDNSANLPLSIVLKDGNSVANTAYTNPANSGSVCGIDAHRPVVEAHWAWDGVSSSPADHAQDGTWPIGHKVYLLLNFAEQVTITGTPEFYFYGCDVPVLYDKTADDNFHNVLSGSQGQNVFSYTVTEGHSHSGLETSTSVITNGSIKDAHGNSYNSIDPIGRVGGTFASKNSINTDGDRPTVLSAVANPPAGQYTNGTQVSYLVTFSEPVTNGSVGIQTGDLKYFAGTEAHTDISFVSAHSTDPDNQYIFTNGGLGTSNATIGFYGGDGVIDAHGNRSALNYLFENSSYVYLVDHTNPTAAITAPLTNSYQKTLSAITGTAGDAAATVNSGLASVQVAAYVDNNHNGSFDIASDFYFNGTNWTTVTTETFLTPTGTDTWSIDPKIIADGDYYVYAKSTDNAGNTYTSSPIKFTIDNVSATINSATLTTNGNQNGTNYYAKSGNTITLVVAASEPITTPTVTIGGATATTATTSPASSYTFTLEVDATHPTLDGSAGILVSNISDRAGNTTADYSSQTNAAIVDRALPTITTASTSAIGVSTGAQTNQYYVDITVSEAIYTDATGTSVVVPADFSANYNQNTLDAASLTIDAITRTDNTNPASATATTAGDLTMRIFFHTNIPTSGVGTVEFTPASATSIYDFAGNAMSTSSTSGVKTLLDRVAPTIQLVAVNGVTDGNVWVKSSATATITFQIVEVKAALTADPLVKVTDASNNLLGTATRSGAPTGLGTGANPYSYTYTITGLTGDYSACKVTLDATDNAGNVASQVMMSPALTIDNTFPTVAITVPVAGTYFTGDSHVQYTVSDNNASATTQAEIGGATLADFSTNGLMKDLAGWSSVANGSTGNKITVSHTDKAGNTGTAIYYITRDNTAPVQTAPTVASIGAPVVANYFNNSNTDVHISTTLASDATLVGGSYKIQYSTDGTNYSDATDITAHTIASGEQGTTLVSSLTASQFKTNVRTTDGVVYFRAVTTDAAGNTTNGDASAVFNRDITAPGISALTVTSDNTINNKYAKDGAVNTTVITANENVTVTAATAEGNNVIAGVTGATSTWNMPWTVAGALNKAYAFSFTLTDVAGNTASYTEANITSGGDVTIDNTSATQNTPTYTALSNNVVSGYYNLTNDGFKISVPLASDASLWNGTNGGTYSIKYDVDNAGTWSNTITALGTSGVISITTGQIGTTVDQTLTHDQLVALLPNITSNHTITFKVVTTDLAGNPQTSSATGATTVDLIAPTATLVSATSDNVINIKEKTDGFTAVAKSSEATGTLYIVDVTTNPTPTYATIVGATVGFASNAVTVANTDNNISVSSGVASTYILTGKTYKAYTMDVAGNLSPASTASFTTDLVAPTITSVSTTSVNKTYIIGNTVNFTLNLSEAAIFTANGGNASLGLNLVAGTTTALLSSDNASSLTLPLTYTVAVNDTVNDLTHGALTLNGSATLTDAAGNPVDLTMPDVATFQGAHAIVIDGIRPTFTVQYYLQEGRITSLGNNPMLNTVSAHDTWIEVVTSELLSSAPVIRIDAQGTNNDVASATMLATSDSYKWKYNRQIVADDLADGSIKEDISVYGVDANGNASLTNGTPAGGVNSTNEALAAAYVDAKSASFTVQYYTDAALTNAITAGSAPYLKAGTYYMKISASEVMSENPYITINAEGTANDITALQTTHVSGFQIYKIQRTIATDAAAVGVLQEAITIFGRDFNSNVTNYVAPTNAGDGAAFTDTKAPTLTGTIFTAPTTANGWWRDGVNQPITWNNGASSISDEGGLKINPIALEWEYNTTGVYGNTIIAAWDNTGSANLTPITSSANSAAAMIRMTVTDRAGNISYAYTEPFHLDNTLPTIAGITTPATGAFLKGGASTIVWNGVADATYQLTATPIKLELTTDGGSNYTELTAGVANSTPYTYDWTVPSFGTVDSATANIRLTATDMAGNTKTLSTGDFTIDNKAPVITVASTVSDNGYDNTKANADDMVTITFSSNEILSGISDIVLSSGPSATTVHNSTAPSATYDVITDTWTIDYTVVPTDADGILSYSFVSTDLAGNTTLTEGTSEIEVLAFDNTAPYVVSCVVTPDNSAEVLNDYVVNYNTSQITVVTVFSEPMAHSLPLAAPFPGPMNNPNPSPLTNPMFDFGDFGAQLTLDGSSWSVDNTTLTEVYIIDQSGNTLLSAPFSIMISSAQDLASNMMADTTFVGYKIDQVKPLLISITPSFASADNSWDKANLDWPVLNRISISNNVYFDIKFNSEMAQTTLLPDLALNPGVNLTPPSSSDLSAWQSDKETYRKYFTVNDDGDEEPSVAVNVFNARDLAGNYVDSTSSDNYGKSSVFGIDVVAPVISSFTIDGGTAGDNYIKNGETAKARFDNVDDFDFTNIGNTAKIGGRNVTAITPETTYVLATYDIPADESSLVQGHLPYAFQIADKAGNLSILATNASSSLIYDRTAPICSTATVTAVNNTPTNSYTINGSTTSITVVANFDEVMTSTLAPTFTFGTGLAGILAPTTGSWDVTNKIYTQNYSVSATSPISGTYSLDITAATDLATNPMTTKTITGIKVDQQAPTLTFYRAYQSEVANTNTTDYYAKFGEPVYFEFTADQNIDMSSALILEFDAARARGGQTISDTYTDGTNTVYGIYGYIDANYADGPMTFRAQVKDFAGNPSNIISPTSNVIVDKVAPTFTVTYPTANVFTNGSQHLNYSVTDNNKDESGTKLAFTGGTADYIATDALISSIPGWEGLADSVATTLTFTHTDKAGNIGTTSVNVIKDTKKPTCSIVLNSVTLGENSSKTTTDDVVSFALNFNEALTGFTTSNVTINATGVSYTSSSLSAPVNNVYTYTISGITGDGTLGITVDNNFTDLAANAMTLPVTSSNFNIDNTVPTITKVENNCTNTPINGYLYNKAARITFSEPVYSGSHASGAIAESNLSITSVKDGSSGASLSSWEIITSTAGGSVLDVSTTWDGATVLGNEKLYVDPSGATQVYDKAGNALAVIGHSTLNWDYAKAQLVVLVNPKDTNVCESSSVNMTLQAQGGNSVSYKWQYKLAGGSTFADANNVAGVSFSGYTTATLTIAQPLYSKFNGAQFQCIVSNACALEAITTPAKTLTVYQAVGVATVADQSACFGSTDVSFTAVAVGKPSLSYDWQYYNGSSWIPVASETTTGATYNTATPGTLGVSGATIPAAVYSYRVVVSGPCGTAITSNTATLTVHALPNATLAVGGTGTICINTPATITVANAENGVSYQLRVGTTPVAGVASQTGAGSTLTFVTGNLSTGTTFNVLATNTNNCSTQLTGTAVITIQNTPVVGSLAKGAGVTGNVICEGTDVSATLTPGTGGTADELEFSYDGGSYNAYTSASSITTNGHTSVSIRTRRIGTVCATPTDYAYVSWTIEGAVHSGTITKNPTDAAVCAGTTVKATFAGAAGGSGSVYQYSTNGGSSWSTYVPNADITTSSAISSAYTISVRTIRNATVCTPETSAVASWTVNPLPTATISGGTTTCSGTEVTLSVALTGAQPWSITLNGTPITGISASPYTFKVSPIVSTIYTITSVSDNNTCSNSTISATTITVTQPAAANAGAMTATICQGSTYSLSSATASNYSSVSWATSGQGSFTNANILRPTYVPAGTDFGHTVRLTLTANGVTPCGNVMSWVDLTVNPLPSANATANGTATSKTVCAGSVINLSTPSIGGMSYSWTGPHGFTSTSNAPTIASAVSDNAGTYEVTVLNTTTGCSNTSSVAVVVNPLPTAAISGSTSVCAGSPANLTFTLTGTSPWQVVYNNGTSNVTVSNIATSSYQYAVTPSSTTTYTLVSVSDANTCTNTASGSATITINPYPSAAGTISGTASVNAGQTNVAYNVGAITNANANLYVWHYSGSGATITGTTNAVTITFAVGATSGDLTVKGQNDCGFGTISAAYPIVVNSAVAPSFTAQPGNVTLCGTTSATTSFTATASGAPAPSYKWQVSTDGTIYNDITASTDGGVYSGFGTGTLSLSSVVGLSVRYYHAIATNGVNPVATSNPATLTVNDLPSAPVITGTIKTCSGSTAVITPVPVSGVNFHYYASDGITSLGSDSHLITPALTTATDYYVEAFTATCVSATKTKVTVQIDELPAAPIASNAIICIGRSTTITPTPVSGVDFNFYTVPTGGTSPNGGSATTAFTVSPTATTSYFVEAHNMLTGCLSARTEVIITVDQAPVAPTSIGAAASSAPAVPVTSFNTGTQYTFTAIGSTNARSYTWTVPATWTINSANQTTSTILVTAGTGSGNITAVANNACLSSSAVALAVAPMASEPTNSALTMTARSKTSITLRVVGHTGAGRLIRGIFAGALPGNITAVVDGTTYTTNATLGTSLNATDGMSYLYSGSDTLITVSGLASNKSYTFAVYEYNGSASTINYTSASAGYTFKTTLKEGDEQIDENTTTGFSVSAITPNPASTDVNFTVSASEASQFKVELYNENGQAAYSNIFNLNNGDNQVSFSLASAKGVMPAGVYYLRVSANGETIVKQVIVNP